MHRDADAAGHWQGREATRSEPISPATSLPRTTSPGVSRVASRASSVRRSRSREIAPDVAAAAARPRTTAAALPALHSRCRAAHARSRDGSENRGTRTDPAAHAAAAADRPHSSRNRGLRVCDRSSRTSTGFRSGTRMTPPTCPSRPGRAPCACHPKLTQRPPYCIPFPRCSVCASIRETRAIVHRTRSALTTT